MSRSITLLASMLSLAMLASASMAGEPAARGACCRAKPGAGADSPPPLVWTVEPHHRSSGRSWPPHGAARTDYKMRVIRPAERDYRMPVLRPRIDSNMPVLVPHAT